MTIDKSIDNVKNSLISKLDSMLYLPMNKELKGATYSLEKRKEDFKKIIEVEMEELENEINQENKDVVKQLMLQNWGERCPDYCEDCPACKAWKYYDYLFELDKD